MTSLPSMYPARADYDDISRGGHEERRERGAARGDVRRFEAAERLGAAGDAAVDAADGVVGERREDLLRGVVVLDVRLEFVEVGVVLAVIDALARDVYLATERALRNIDVRRRQARRGVVGRDEGVPRHGGVEVPVVEPDEAARVVERGEPERRRVVAVGIRRPRARRRRLELLGEHDAHGGLARGGGGGGGGCPRRGGGPPFSGGRAGGRGGRRRRAAPLAPGVRRRRPVRGRGPLARAGRLRARRRALPGRRAGGQVVADV
mmetsp:Transcript_8559/g.35248  ORF Transcript_8559/g.35248 Transcript_8559/m.35248 type:complete len:263 (+) Transcript_8559:496-1284(+)